MKIYLDNEREAPSGWIRAYWPDEALQYLNTGQVEEISLNHDLGDNERGTGYDVLLWIEKEVVLSGFTPPVMKVHDTDALNRSILEEKIKTIQDLSFALGH